MSGVLVDESILEVYILELSQSLDQLESIILGCEQAGVYLAETVNDIFRIMHTIKGSSSMMGHHSFSSLAHVLEDLFSFLRQQTMRGDDYSRLSELMLDGIDFMKGELEKIKNGDPVDGKPDELIGLAKKFLDILEFKRQSKNDQKPVVDEKETIKVEESLPKEMAGLNEFEASIHLDDCDEMENVRAFQIIHRFKEDIDHILFEPKDLDTNFETAQVIKEKGFKLYFHTDKSFEEVEQLFSTVTYVQSYDIRQVEKAFDDKIEVLSDATVPLDNKPAMETARNQAIQSSFISVNVTKLDELMDLVGELVIAESMVTQNPEITVLQLEQFTKAARHLKKITYEIQDKVMSIRMVPLTSTFNKMNRIVRDMSKKLGKNVELHLIGEQTEVDKNIIEKISDPLMHIVRNAIDHGIESNTERFESGKPESGKLVLEARNAGNEVWIMIRDDGRGLNKDKLLLKAKQKGLLFKEESQMTDSEIYNLIFLPGFSTKEEVTEFSGRGVGLDVVAKNINTVGGTVMIDSDVGKGTTISIRIPLTLAIIDGMNLKAGNTVFTLPTTHIKETFRPQSQDILRNPEGNEMIMVRGNCYPIIRLHKRLGIQASAKNIEDGILIMAEYAGGFVCIFADELIGQQQVVLKALPAYVKKISKIEGITGCTLLGDGSISLILDVDNLVVSG